MFSLKVWLSFDFFSNILWLSTVNNGAMRSQPVKWPGILLVFYGFFLEFRVELALKRNSPCFCDTVLHNLVRCLHNNHFVRFNIMFRLPVFVIKNMSGNDPAILSKIRFLLTEHRPERSSLAWQLSWVPVTPPPVHLLASMSARIHLTWKWYDRYCRNLNMTCTHLHMSVDCHSKHFF